MTTWKNPTWQGQDESTRTAFQSLQKSLRWIDYVPTWTCSITAPAVGNGSLLGRYTLVGMTCTYRIALVWGSTTNGGTGDFQFTLPFTAASTPLSEQWTGITKVYTSDNLQYGGGAYIGYGGNYGFVVPEVQFGANSAMGGVRNADVTAAVGTGLPTVAGKYTFEAAGRNLALGGFYEVAAPS